MTVLDQDVVSSIAVLADEIGAQFDLLPNDPAIHSSSLQSLIEGSDIFIGVLPDGSHHFIKGRGLLERIAGGVFQSGQSAIGAIHCKCAEEAEAMRLVFGDGATVAKSTSRTRLNVVRAGR